MLLLLRGFDTILRNEGLEIDMPSAVSEGREYSIMASKDKQILVHLVLVDVLSDPKWRKEWRLYALKMPAMDH